jgi:hypothetical protein
VDDNEASELRRTVKALLTAPPPVRLDAARIGTVFIDVLFGAVTAKALDLSTSLNGVPAAGRAQLTLAMIVTITSWLGYHNSSGRNSYRIMFFNLPLLQFVIEILHLLVYWLLVTTSAQWQGPTHLKVSETAIPETVLVAVVFILFCAWDFTALAMRRSAKYEEMKLEDDNPPRRAVTLYYTALFAILSLIIFLTESGGFWIIAMAVLLAVLVVSHRWLQNVVQAFGAPTDTRAAPVDASTVASPPSPVTPSHGAST